MANWPVQGGEVVGFLRLRRRLRVVRGRTVEFEWIDHPDVVAVLPFLPDGRVVLVRQYRAPVDAETVEVPAGSLDPGEGVEDAARRELAEETGYRADRFTYLGAFYPAIGYSSERIHCLAAFDLTPGETSFDESEEIEVLRVDPAELATLIRDGQIRDAKSIIAFFLWQKRRAAT
ncbi:MAG: NUDIX hydrolase [Clostridia bacterium]|nr:NUDIX hydrolase [Clostridia bacterium]